MLDQGTGRVQSLFVDAMVREAGSDKDAKMWQTILRSVLSTLTGTSFTDATALQSKLFALDVFLRSPMLQKLLVSSSVFVRMYRCQIFHVQVAHMVPDM